MVFSKSKSFRAMCSRNNNANDSSSSDEDDDQMSRQLTNMNEMFAMNMNSSSSFFSHEAHSQTMQVKKIQTSTVHRSEMRQSWHQQFSKAYTEGQITTQSHTAMTNQVHVQHIEGYSTQVSNEMTHQNCGRTTKKNLVKFILQY